MKRTLTVLMTLALIGSMAFIGFAGTAAAGGNHHDDDSGDDLDAAASVSQSQSVSQANVISQNASQFASQEAIGADLGELPTVEPEPEPEEASIDSITFYRSPGESGNIQAIATFNWNANLGEYVLVDSMSQGDRIVVTGDEFEATYDASDISSAEQVPVQAVVTNADGTECTVELSGESGSIEPCVPDDTTNGGTGDDVNDGTPAEGSTGNQTVNQIVDQDADASNSNAQNADASASAGDILSVLLG